MTINVYDNSKARRKAYLVQSYKTRTNAMKALDRRHERQGVTTLAVFTNPLILHPRPKPREINSNDRTWLDRGAQLVTETKSTEDNPVQTRQVIKMTIEDQTDAAAGHRARSFIERVLRVIPSTTQ